MFCPKCSQEQVSDELRFCSRCGFRLGVVKALLVNDAASGDGDARPLKRPFNKRDASIGASLMFLLALLIAAITVGLPPAHSAPILLLLVAWPLLVLLINIKPILRYFVKGDAGMDERSASPALRARFKQPLPAPQSIPTDLYIPKAPDTADMSVPRSVTEGTTNLLKDN
jgi:hypothetical protein